MTRFFAGDLELDLELDFVPQILGLSAYYIAAHK